MSPGRSGPAGPVRRRPPGPPRRAVFFRVRGLFPAYGGPLPVHAGRRGLRGPLTASFQDEVRARGRPSTGGDVHGDGHTAGAALAVHAQPVVGSASGTATVESADTGRSPPASAGLLSLVALAPADVPRCLGASAVVGQAVREFRFVAVAECAEGLLQRQGAADRGNAGEEPALRPAARGGQLVPGKPCRDWPRWLRGPRPGRRVRRRPGRALRRGAADRTPTPTGRSRHRGRRAPRPG